MTFYVHNGYVWGNMWFLYVCVCAYGVYACVCYVMHMCMCVVYVVCSMCGCIYGV